MDEEHIFRALADPSRRLLLDRLLVRDGSTLLELQAQLTMTRFGVMKHLRVLEEAGLITTRKVGREKLHFLNPVPIQLIYDRWIDKYTAARASVLADLKAVLEGETTMAGESAARPRQIYRMIIKASPERVWEAVTTPEFTKRYYYGCLLQTDLTPGSPFRYVSGDGSNTFVEGEVLVSEPPHRLVHSYRSLWGPLAQDAPTRVTWELAAMAGGITNLTVIHDDFDGETATYNGLASGGWTWILSNLKTLLETGEPLPS